MIHNLMYIELKTGFSDNGPEWIGYVKTSKSKKTIYFNGHAFQKYIGSYSNYIDVENGDMFLAGSADKEALEFFRRLIEVEKRSQSFVEAIGISYFNGKTEGV